MTSTLRVNYICFVKKASKITRETDMITAGYITFGKGQKARNWPRSKHAGQHTE